MVYLLRHYPSLRGSIPPISFISFLVRPLADLHPQPLSMQTWCSICRIYFIMFYHRLGLYPWPTPTPTCPCRKTHLCLFFTFHSSCFVIIFHIDLMTFVISVKSYLYLHILPDPIARYLIWSLNSTIHLLTMRNGAWSSTWIDPLLWPLGSLTGLCFFVDVYHGPS